MSTIDQIGGRTPACSCAAGRGNEKASRGGKFAAVLRAAAAVASVAAPAIGPAIGAIAGAIDRGRLAQFDAPSDTLRYLELQRAIAEETRAFETASNVMKARHDAAMNSIRNMRS